MTRHVAITRMLGTVLDEIVENALTQQQEDDTGVQRSHTQSNCKSFGDHGMPPASIQQQPQQQQQQQQIRQHQLNAVPDACRLDCQKDGGPMSLLTPDRSLKKQAASGPYHSGVALPKPGNVRDIIESLVTAELMHSNDTEKVKDDEDGNAHVLSMAIRKLYGLHKSGHGSDNVPDKLGKPSVRVEKLPKDGNFQMAMLVRVEDGPGDIMVESHSGTEQSNKLGTSTHSPVCPHQTSPVQGGISGRGPMTLSSPVAMATNAASKSHEAPTQGTPQPETKSETNSACENVDNNLKRKLSPETLTGENEKGMEMKRP